MTCTLARRSHLCATWNTEDRKVHGVHPPIPAAPYKMADFEECEHSSPTSFFLYFPRVFSAKTHTKPPLEAQLKIQMSSFQGLELGLKIEDQKQRLKEEQAAISLIR